MKYTFFELQKQYKIIIPQIQRDYAQGRIDTNNDQKIKGYDFIGKLIDVVTVGKTALNLDFVYGYTEEIGKEQLAFIPLDGQQRLTTLWLLHWYLSPKQESEKDGCKAVSVKDEIKLWLGNFTYETRNSSKRFCEALIEKSLPETKNICEAIKDASWFMASWKNDPTVVSMLNMLAAIQQHNFDKNIAWRNLIENKKITFDYIDIKSGEFKLTDELYIKMNARGKPLTAFENFKAQFSEILSAKTEYQNEKLIFENAEVSFQEYFAFKIDTIWTDLFWKFSLNQNQNQDISDCCMNFFTYIAQMCYFKDNLEKQADDFKNDFSIFNAIFKKKENTLFLFKALDFFYKLSIDENNQVQIEKIDTFFSNLFYTGQTAAAYQERVRLFEKDSKGSNLFTKCLEEGSDFENRNRIILFCILQYVMQYNISDVNNGLRRYIRVIRNLLQAIRQRSETVYNTNVRINDFGSYWKLFKQLVSDADVYAVLQKSIDNKATKISDTALNNEKEKADIIKNTSVTTDIVSALFQLEESEPFNGLIHQLKPQDNYTKFSNYVKALNDLWGNEDLNELRIAALIACDFGGFYTKNCHFGQIQMRTFGQYNTIFTGEGTKEQNENISKSIVCLLDTYVSKTANSTIDKLKSIIEDKLKSITDRGWQYYFLKYYEKMFKHGSYFAWENDFAIETLLSERSNPLVAYHINPYVSIVSSELDDTICEEQYCWSQYSEKSCVRLKNDIVLSCKEEGWKIELPKDFTLQDSIKQKFNLDANLLLKDTADKDRIEVAVAFCKDAAL